MNYQENQLLIIELTGLGLRKGMFGGQVVTGDTKQSQALISRLGEARLQKGVSQDY